MPAPPPGRRETRGSRTRDQHRAGERDRRGGGEAEPERVGEGAARGRGQLLSRRPAERARPRRERRRSTPPRGRRARACRRSTPTPMIEPITATPSAPPTWRVTSVIAEPTPALLSGTAPMTESVAGAIAAPIESASPNVTSASSTGAMSGVHSRLVLSTAATPTRPPAITRVRPTRPTSVVGRPGADHQAERQREHHRARLQRAVAERELQELREGEDRAHHREEDERDADRGDGEARVAEEPQRQHRRGDAALPRDERRAERPRRRRSSRARAGPSSRAAWPR